MAVSKYKPTLFSLSIYSTSTMLSILSSLSDSGLPAEWFGNALKYGSYVKQSLTFIFALSFKFIKAAITDSFRLG
jgi:hypothetical protein